MGVTSADSINNLGDTADVSTDSIVNLGKETNIVTDSLGWFSGIIESTGNILKKNFSGIGSLEGSEKTLGDHATTVKKGATELYNKGSEVVKEIGSSEEFKEGKKQLEKVKEVYDKAKPEVSEAVNEAKEKSASTWETVTGWFEDGTKPSGETLEKGGASIGVGEAGPEIVNQSLDGKVHVTPMHKLGNKSPNIEKTIPYFDQLVMNMVERHEGRVMKIYKDSLGKATYGVGHLMRPTDNFPIPPTDEFVDKLFHKDYIKHKIMATTYPDFESFNEPVQAAIIDMSFNMGKFWNQRNTDKNKYWKKKLVDFTDKKEFDEAAKSIMTTGYAKQVKGRAVEIAELIAMGDQPGAKFPSKIGRSGNYTVPKGPPRVTGGGVDSGSSSGPLAWLDNIISKIMGKLGGKTSDLSGEGGDRKSGGGQTLPEVELPPKDPNQPMDQYYQTALWNCTKPFDGKSPYEMGGKTPGKIDCSGFTSFGNRCAMKAVDDACEKEGKPPIYGKAGRKKLETGAAWQFSNSLKDGGGALYGVDNIKAAAQPGMLAVLDTTSTSHAARENRPKLPTSKNTKGEMREGYGISHVLQFIQNPDTKELMVAESRGSKHKRLGTTGIMFSTFDEYFGKDYLGSPSRSKYTMGATNVAQAFKADELGKTESSDLKKVTEKVKSEGKTYKFGINNLKQDGLVYAHKGEDIISTDPKRRMAQIEDILVRMNSNQMKAPSPINQVPLKDIKSDEQRYMDMVESSVKQSSIAEKSQQAPIVVPVPIQQPASQQIHVGSEVKEEGPIYLTDSFFERIISSLFADVPTKMLAGAEKTVGYSGTPFTA